jgi:hypothetical protein
MRMKGVSDLARSGVIAGRQSGNFTMQKRQTCSALSQVKEDQGSARQGRANLAAVSRPVARGMQHRERR